MKERIKQPKSTSQEQIKQEAATVVADHESALKSPDHGLDNITVQKKNNTGLPDSLKSGIENLSGYSMDDVKVYRNSDKPAKIQAHAYAQGTDIHLGPGQEKHLPHEAWHVVQQKQGRVKLTMQLKGKVNDNAGLEKEADVMGAKALQTATARSHEASCQPNGYTTIQRKHRIDLDKVKEEDKEKITIAINELKHIKRTAKKNKTITWASANDKDDQRDITYNTDMERIRKDYEDGIKSLATLHKIEESALVSGDKYYGEKVEENGLTFHRRLDTGKEYVKDKRGTFVPRYIRRELNNKDTLDSKITTQGISTYDQLQDIKSTGPGGKNALSWEHREFLQQSLGGGNNLFALSHTSTKRPILSNAHGSFGQKPEKFEHSGAIITDLAKMSDINFAAQWTISKESGHKVMLPEGVHQTLDWKNIKDSGKERDKVVRRSGYRNKEIVAESVPNAAIIQPDESWKTAEGPKTDYHQGQSKRGNKLSAYRAEKQQEALEVERKKKEELLNKK